MLRDKEINGAKTFDISPKTIPENMRHSVLHAETYTSWQLNSRAAVGDSKRHLVLQWRFSLASVNWVPLEYNLDYPRDGAASSFDTTKLDLVFSCSIRSIDYHS